MIEVEKGFILTPEQEEKLIADAEFLGERKMVDAYYDDERYSLTLNDFWLRTRNGKFELKIPHNKPIEERVSDQYEELENEADILNYFQASGKTMSEFLAEKGYKPFCSIATARRKYRKEGFNIDLDVTDFGYANAEIECMIADQAMMDEATRAIIAFAAKHGITQGDRWGKVIEFVRRNNPAHFQMLLDAKLIK